VPTAVTRLFDHVQSDGRTALHALSRLLTVLLPDAGNASLTAHVKVLSRIVTFLA
jgi:hypothetical protein